MRRSSRLEHSGQACEQHAFGEQLAHHAFSAGAECGRIAISRPRVVARARSRFATFTHAISSTSPTAAISMSSAGRIDRVSCSRSASSCTPKYLFVSGYCLASAERNYVHRSLRLSDRNARLQARDHVEKVRAALLGDWRRIVVSMIGPPKRWSTARQACVATEMRSRPASPRQPCRPVC